MIVAGKREPEPEPLENAASEGFDWIEVYLERCHLEDIDETILTLKESDVSVASVHTPHVSLEEGELIKRASRIADEFDAELVFHSAAIHYSPISDIFSQISLEASPQFENHPGHSLHHIENSILEAETGMTLDLAHLYIGVGDEWENVLEYLLTTYENDINVVHFCDALGNDDGHPFELGDIDLEKAFSIVKQNYDGILVLELPKTNQEDLLRKIDSINQIDE